MPGSGLVPLKIFMSGAAFAVSAAGAEKILRSLPCHEDYTAVHYGEYEYPRRFEPLPPDHPANARRKPSMMPSCSAAIDWHLSVMVRRLAVSCRRLLSVLIWSPDRLWMCLAGGF